MNFINNIDHHVSEMFHKVYLWGGEFTNVVMKIISFIGEYGAIFLLTGFALCLFKRTRKVGATIIVSIAVGFVISNLILKNIVQRVRPFQASLEFETWWAGSNGKYESGYSFPSGHVTAAMAFATAVCITTNRKYNWPVMFLPLIMASSRIYLMVHYFTDCLAGMVVGLIGGIIAYFIIKWIYKTPNKLFTWFREVEILKSKEGKEKTSNRKESAEQPAQSKVYVPQSEEEETTLIQQMTQDVDEQENTNSK